MFPFRLVQLPNSCLLSVFSQCENKLAELVLIIGICMLLHGNIMQIVLFPLY